jgi:hypothetical protein
MQDSQALAIRPPPGGRTPKAYAISYEVPRVRQALPIRPPPGGRPQKAVTTATKVPRSLQVAVRAGVEMERLLSNGSRVVSPKTPEALKAFNSMEESQKVRC